MRQVDVWNDDGSGCKLVGRLIANPGRPPSGVHLAFQYDAAWIADGFAIDPENLPLSPAAYHSPDLFPALSDAGPDRWGCVLIDRRNRGSGRGLTAVDYLLALSDQTRVGALRFRERGQAEFMDGSTTPVPPILTVGKLLAAADAVGRGTAGKEEVELLLGSGSPPGGARPKASVLDRDGSLAIAKFPKPDDTRSIARGEVTALKLAEKAGITAAECRLETVRKRDVSVIRRFDRKDGTRIPFISAKTLIGAGKDEIGSYVEIADGILRHGVDARDRAELWRRLAFSRIVSNCDDHLRNHGFLRVGTGWALAPAFDINPVPEAERRQHMATPVSPDVDGGVDAVMATTAAFGLSLADAKQQLAQIVAAVRTWRKEPAMDRGASDAYASAFESPELEAAVRAAATVSGATGKATKAKKR